MATTPATATTFSDLPDDVIIAVLSFLPASDAAAAACSCRRLAALPLFLPLRRLAGFWRAASASGVVSFEWSGPSGRALSAFHVAPSPRPGNPYAVARMPFLRLDPSDTFLVAGDGEVVPANVNFVGPNHIVLEEAAVAATEEEEEVDSSPPDRDVLELYEYFANRTSPVGEKAAARRQRKKGRRRRVPEAEHFVRIPDSEPTAARPLQGLWKGICENMSLQFYLVTYDDIGGISCRRVSETGGQFSGYSSVFWATNTTFLEPPFSEEEQDLYTSCEHVRSASPNQDSIENRTVSRILCINSSYDLVNPDQLNSLDGRRNVKGRIWQYEDGTFGFGFLGNNSIIDLRRVTLDGCILDAVQ